MRYHLASIAHQSPRRASTSGGTGCRRSATIYTPAQRLGGLPPHVTPHPSPLTQRYAFAARKEALTSPAYKPPLPWPFGRPQPICGRQQRGDVGAIAPQHPSSPRRRISPNPLSTRPRRSAFDPHYPGRVAQATVVIMNYNQPLPLPPPVEPP